MKTSGFASVLISGLLLASGAGAQDFSDPLAFGGEVRRDPVGYPPRDSAYSSRSIQPVYDNVYNTFSNGSSTHVGMSNMILEDISFSGGPWAGATGRVITEVTFGIAVLTTPGTTEDFLLVFWDEDDTSFQGTGGTGTNMINPAASPLAVVRVDAAGLNAGFYFQLTSSLTGLPGGGVAVPNGDAGLSLQVAWVTDGFVPPVGYHDLSAGILEGCTSTTMRSTVFASSSLAPAGGNPAVVGSTTTSYGRDISNANMCPNIGRLIGNGAGPVGSGDFEHRSLNATPQRGYMVRLMGNAPPCFLCPPPPPFDVVPQDGLTVVDGNLSAGSIAWSRVVLNGNATDLALRFLDMDTETSAAPVAIALFADTGALLGWDDVAGGSVGHSQLTFGVGRRAAFAGGQGRQYDGRHGQLVAGNYYLATGPTGSTFANGFIANPGPGPGGAYSLRFITNVNGSALAPSVPPFINGVDYGTFDPSTGGDAPGLGQATGVRGVLWSRVQVATPVTSWLFMEVAFDGLSTASADAVAYLFDSQGNVRAYSDDEGPGNLPRLLFGNSTFSTHGTLEAGTYYMATALWEPQDLRAISASHRWHVRATSLSNLTVGADIYTGRGCGSADFDNDGDTGTDLDIEGFFRCVGGECCPACPPDADFDGDGDTGTDADIEAFFRVLAGGAC